MRKRQAVSYDNGMHDRTAGMRNAKHHDCAYVARSYKRNDKGWHGGDKKLHDIQVKGNSSICDRA